MGAMRGGKKRLNSLTETCIITVEINGKKGSGFYFFRDSISIYSPHYRRSLFLACSACVYIPPFLHFSPVVYVSTFLHFSISRL